MASISRAADGRFAVQTAGQDGRRRSFRLGRVPKRDAEQFKVRLEHLERAAKLGTTPDAAVPAWTTRCTRDSQPLDS